MKKEGFTLIELLAVIVIIAIIALISTPTILGVIQKSKKASSEASAYGYIDAVEKYIMTNSMDMSKKDINNGIYKDSELEISYKGKGPDNALVTVEKGIVKEAKLCINKYSFDYDGKEVTNSVNNYCSDNYKIKLVIDDNMQEKSIEKELSTTFELSDITNKTNIVCNNGATPTIENNILTISNIFGDTTCKINNSLEDTINNIDSTKTTITLLSDYDATQNFDFKSNTNVIFNLNNHVINLNGYYFRTYGNLVVNGSEYSKIVNTKQVLNNSGSGKIIVNGGYYERTSGSATAIYNQGTGDIIINEANVISTGACVQNSLNIYEKGGNLIINGGEFVSSGTSNNIENFKGNLKITSGIFISNMIVISVANDTNVEIDNAIIISNNTLNKSAICNNGNLVINNSTYVEGPYAIGCFSSNEASLVVNDGKFIGTIEDAIHANSGYTSKIIINGGYISGNKSGVVNHGIGNININQTDKPIYITSLSQTWNPAILNLSTGTINIKANKADNCTNNIEDTTSGLCVYAEGNKDYTRDTSNTAVSNSNNGLININGGTYFGGSSAIQNHFSGIINIVNSKIGSGRFGLINNRTGSIYICNSKLLSLQKDIGSNPDSTGQINYSNDVIFTDGTNIPKISGPEDNVISNYSGICISS